MLDVASSISTCSLSDAFLLLSIVASNLYISFADTSHDIGAVTCPGSQASVHAWMAMEATLSGSCVDAKDEIKGRVAGSAAGTWNDPHGGTYSYIEEADSSVTVERLSSNGRFSDRMIFSFEETSEACHVRACSESQSTSYADQSTNLCNLWNLLCTSDLVCCPVLHDLKPFTYNVVGKSSYAGSDVDFCLGGRGGSGGGFGGERQTSCPVGAPTTAPTLAVSSEGSMKKRKAKSKKTSRRKARKSKTRKAKARKAKTRKAKT